MSLLWNLDGILLFAISLADIFALPNPLSQATQYLPHKRMMHMALVTAQYKKKYNAILQIHRFPLLQRQLSKTESARV